MFDLTRHRPTRRAAQPLAAVAMWVALATALTPADAAATTVYFELSDLGGDRYEYTYTVVNDSLSVDIEEFTVFFGYEDFANLGSAMAPSGWDPFAVEPDLVLNDDGFFDALALGVGVAPAGTLGGFRVQADWLAINSPGAQSFEIRDPRTFDLLDSGFTKPLPQMPEPSSFVLLALVLVCLSSARSTPTGVRRPL